MKSFESQLGGRLRKSFNVNSFAFLINLITQILTVPILLHYWGINLYGEWILLSALSTYILLSNFGITDAFSNEMTILCGKEKYDQASKIFKNSWLAISISSVLVSFILFIFIFSFPPKSILNIQVLSHTDTLIIIALLVGYILSSIQLSIITSAFKAVKEYSFSVSLLNIIRVSEFTLGIILVYLGYGPKIYIFSSLAIRIAGLLFVIRRLKNKHSWINFSISNFDILSLRQIFKPSVASGGFAFGNLLINQGMILLIGSFLGSAPVVVFNTIRTYSRMLLKVSAISINSYSPEMSSLYGTNKIRLLRFLNRKLIKASFLTSTAIIFLSYFVGEEIIKAWTNDKFPIDHNLYLLILFETFIHSVWYVGHVPITAANKHFNIVLWYIFSGILSLVVAYLLFPLAASIAAPIALIFSDIIISFFVVKEMLKLTKDNIWSVARFTFRL
jgi:O-antigen/teichoic acid export membrane protein